MPATYTPNAPWIDASLRRHWAALERRAGRNLMPLPAPTTKRVDRFSEYGCGHYGCVLPTRTNGVVFKVTSDQTEAVFVAAASSLKNWPDGIVRYYDIVELPGEKRYGRNVFVLWRQEAEAVGIVGPGAAKLIEKELKVDWRGTKQLIAMLHAFRDWASVARDKIVKRKSDPSGLLAEADSKEGWARAYANEFDWSEQEGMRNAPFWKLSDFAKRGANAVALAKFMCEEIAELMANERAGYLVGQALGFYLERGMLLADVHGNNVGLVRHEDYSGLELAITDPGHLVPLDAKWLNVAVPQLEAA